ncbi:hypothetical protein B0J14DRAFT_569126 [Halenospora varia]|nr:hypothetical protein B0J14DRAFT_569126 [Halenospora varia]
MSPSIVPLPTTSPLPPALPQTTTHHSPTPIFCALFLFAILATCIYLTLILIKKLAHLRNDWGYWTSLEDEEREVGFEYSEEVRRAIERRRELARGGGNGDDVGVANGEKGKGKNEAEEGERERRRLERVGDRVSAGYDGFRGN